MGSAAPEAGHQRIAGFDMARAYAILGMLIVNFNYSFGSFAIDSSFNHFLNFFVGKSTAIFIILAGMGLSFMAMHTGDAPGEKKRLRAKVLKRSWFLFFTGILLFVWWPGDILHFYGAYMHIAAFLLFAHKRSYLLLALLAIAIYHALLLIIPVYTGWDLGKFQPTGFWTALGFIRNTFYNGWNSVFPWVAYFMLGMWLGRLRWSSSKTRRMLFCIGLAAYACIYIVRYFALRGAFGPQTSAYFLSEYFPPYLPFMISTSGFALMVITAFMYLGQKFENTKPVKWLADTGSMTLTHYVLHLTLGIMIFSWLTGLPYTGAIQTGTTASPQYIFVFSLVYFAAAVAFSLLWKLRFRHGPLESFMRLISG